jgi:hypothetical protein
MKKCTYCGKEYTNEASECVIDGQPLASFPPEPELIAADLQDETKTVTIQIFSSRDAANIAHSNLEAHGIQCWVNTDDCGGWYSNLTAANGVRLLVRASDAEAATALLDAQASPAEINQIEAEAVASAPPETVPLKNCLCGKSYPAPLLV